MVPNGCLMRVPLDFRSRRKPVRYTYFLTVIFCVFVMSSCSSNPCAAVHVVQANEDHGPGAEQAAKKRLKLQAVGINSVEEDVELDDGHTYLVPFAWSINSDGTQSGFGAPSTGDELTLCKLTAADGSNHYSIRYKGEKHSAELIR